MNPEIRQLLILVLLRQRPHGMAPSGLRDTIREWYAAEDEASAHRRFTGDLAALRRAHLVHFVDLRRGQVVQLIAPEKDPSLRFTPAEHDALRRAREQVGPPAPGVDPIPVDAATAKVATVLRVIRCIEELGGGTASQIAACAGVRATKVRELLARLAAGAAVLEQPLGAVDVELDDTDRAGRPVPSYAGLGRVVNADDPLVGRGMDQFGLFAYGRSEVEDRLELIDRAVAAGCAEPDALEPARWKLEAWRRRLDQTHG